MAARVQCRGLSQLPEARGAGELVVLLERGERALPECEHIVGHLVRAYTEVVTMRGEAPFGQKTFRERAQI